MFLSLSARDEHGLLLIVLVYWLQRKHTYKKKHFALSVFYWFCYVGRFHLIILLFFQMLFQNNEMGHSAARKFCKYGPWWD